MERDRAYLLDILDAARLALSYTESIHEYDDVDLSIVWNTVRNDLPPLISALQKIIGGEVA